MLNAWYSPPDSPFCNNTNNNLSICYRLNIWEFCCEFAKIKNRSESVYRLGFSLSLFLPLSLQRSNYNSVEYISPMCHWLAFPDVALWRSLLRDKLDRSLAGRLELWPFLQMHVCMCSSNTRMYVCVCLHTKCCVGLFNGRRTDCRLDGGRGFYACFTESLRLVDLIKVESQHWLINSYSMHFHMTNI